MPYLPIAPQSDDRRVKQGCAPIQTVNVLVRSTPSDSARARRSAYFIAPAPGRVQQAELPDLLRGLFAKTGCRDGRLYIPNGAMMSEMTSSYAYTSVGAISGGDVVTMRADRADLRVRSFGLLYAWDGTTFQQVTDPNAPTFAQTLAIVARRGVAAFQDNDAFGWAKAGDFFDWDANGQAVDQDVPDPIVGQEEINGDLWSFNAESTQVWQATGGAEASAFARVSGVSIPRGLAGREAIAPMGGGMMLVANTRQIYGTSGYDLSAVPCPALEQDLKGITDAELSATCCWSYVDSGKEFFGMNAGLERGWVFDSEVGLFHQRSKYGAAVYDIDFATKAFGKVFVGSRQSNKVWTLEDDVYVDGQDDDGEDIPIQRIFTVAIPSQGDVPVSRIVWDLVTRDVPITGQGSEPVMQVRTSTDNGENWSEWRDIALPTNSNKFRVQDFAFGMASNENGMLIQHRITDPIGFAIWGLWVNPSLEELNA